MRRFSQAAAEAGGEAFVIGTLSGAENRLCNLTCSDPAADITIVLICLPASQDNLILLLLLCLITDVLLGLVALIGKSLFIWKLLGV